MMNSTAGSPNPSFEGSSGSGGGKSLKRKTYSPISPSSDTQPKSKFRLDATDEDLSTILSGETIDLQKGMKILIKLQLESNQTTERLIKRLDVLTAWLENIDEAIVDIESRVTDIEEKLKCLPAPSQDEVSNFPKPPNFEYENMQRKLCELEDRSRRNNIVISGLVEVGSESWEDSEKQVVELCSSKLGIVDIPIERAHRLGRKMPNKNRPIICKLLNFKDKELIKRNGFKLKGTNIFINDDFSQRTRTARYHLRNFMKEMKSKGAVSAKLNYDKLFIDGKLYVYNFETSRVVESVSSV